MTAEPTTAEPTTTGPGGYVLPASFGQSRLWLLEELEPGSGAAYVEHVAARLHGPLDVAALRGALTTVVDRHEVLRSALVLVDETTVQLVVPDLPVRLTEVDLTGDPDGLPATIDAALRAFDLATPPLWRATLVRVADGEHVLVVAFHHAVYDQWSGAVFLRELLAGYTEAVGGPAAALPELPIQYGDFAAWQQSRSGSERERDDIAFWARRLWGLTPLELPVDTPRSATQTHVGATVGGALSADVVRAMQEVSTARGATPFMTCLAAFTAVLARWSGQDDITVGSPIAGRNRPETQDLIGFFVNNLVLRTDVADDPTFDELLGRVRGTCIEAFAHAELPFERLVESLAPARDLSRSPLFQVMFVFGNVPMPVTDAGGLRLEPLRFDPGTAKFDLFFALVPDGDGLRVVLEYSSALFSRATAERFVEQFERLLAAGVADPGTRVSDLPLMSPEQEIALRAAGTGADREVPATTVAQRVAARAAEHPDRPAVGCGSAGLSYGELDREVSRLAQYLLAQGIRAGDRVAVALPRGIDLVVALLAVLRAGAAYVPLDPEYPADRLGFVLDDAQVAAVVTVAAVRDRVAGPHVTVCLDERRAEIAACPDSAPDVPVGADDPAYLIYTSGSTGRPKGVTVPHGALVNLLRSMAVEPGLGPDDVLAAVTTPAFDIAALELFLPVVVGGRLELVPAEDGYDGDLLAARLAACAATAMQATPTTWRLLVDTGWRAPERFTALCGGEAMPAELAAAMVATGASTWNMYGPTETTIWSTVHQVTGREATVPLGHPIDNTTIVVVDRAGAPCPPGIPGELWIGGAGVAHGYWNRPELTAERFVPAPAGHDGTFYRTGDRVRRAADGELEYLGRLDHQIKLRGLRIEPGEIESVLRGLPAVAEAVVIVREDAPGDPRLVGYVVAAPGVDAQELPAPARAHLRAHLPEHMVPGDIVVLDAFPLTPNRKVDRSALPAPSRAATPGLAAAPNGETERAVLEVFAEVLGRDGIGANDDFFAVGGHSLLAARAAARLRARLHVDLPVRRVFQHPTAAGLAATLTDGTTVSPGAVVPVPRVPEPTGPHAGAVVLPASFQQRRVWFLHQLDPASTSAYTLHGAVRLRGRLDRDALQRSVDALVARHEILRTGLATVDDEPVQVVHPDVPLDLETLEAGDAALREHATRPFDLARPPLMRVGIVPLAADDQILQIVLHHGVADRVTVDVVTDELARAYDSAVAGAAAVSTPPLAVQYGDYAAWQQDRLDGPEVQGQVEHWRTVLDGLPVLDLPTDRPRSSTQRYDGATRTAALPAELVQRLQRLADAHDATLFMVLLAGYALLLARRSGQSDLAIGTPVDSRDRPELEPLVGYLTNNLVLRTDLSGDPTVAELLAAVRATCLDAYAAADVPFEQLVEHLAPRRDLTHTPLFQVMFIMMHLERPVLELAGLESEALPAAVESAKYDLTFIAHPRDGGFAVIAEYRTDLFDAVTVDLMLAEYVHLLEQTVLASTPIGELELLPPAEHALLDTWGTGPAMPVPPVSVPDLLGPAFAEHAGRVAVSDGDTPMTYAELDAAADRVAHRLRARGVGRGSLVAVLLERCPDMLVALLGVLRSGAAYVPMEVNFPQDRLRYLVEDSGAALVLTQPHLTGLVPPTGATVVTVDALTIPWPGSGAPRGAPTHGALPDPPGPDDLAYVIYTSGSTGRPKGVPLTHRPVVNFLLTMAEEPGLSGDAVVAAANTIACDMPVLDLYLPLLRGARIETVRLADTVDGERLAARLASSAVTVMQGTPTTWRLLRETGWCPPPGFTALAGAEKVPADLARWLRGRASAAGGRGHGATVWHLYGPTETTVWSTVHRVAEEDPLPLGHPVANTELLVLDPAQRRVPIGVPGELYIGGAGLASGYLNRPDQTGERFVPAASGPARLLYRTGDLVRYRADGTLDFLGRTDFQVKLRGFRIELGEIEAALRAGADLADVVVVLREDDPGDPRLVAYVVPTAPDADDDLVDRLFAALRPVLPGHMVPSAIVVLDALPLTLNRNKVDRAALPAPGGSRPVACPGPEPRNPAERVVTDAFAEVLGVDRVGIDDDFFALGGHSLLATRLVGRLRAAGLTVPVRAVFEHPTPAGLAGSHAGVAPDAAPDAIPVVARTPEPDGPLAGLAVLPASFQQRRVWFLDQLTPGSAGAYLMRGALRLRGALRPDVLAQALDLVVERHETLRTSLVAVDGEPVQVVHPGVRVPIRHVDLTALDAGERERAVQDLVARSGDSVTALTQAPLIEVVLARLRGDEHVLVVASHHVISDRLSTEIMVRELSAQYRALVERGAPDPAPVPLQYGDYAAWQRLRLAGDRLDADLAHWRRALDGLGVLDLPTDRPRPAVQTHRGATRTATLPASLVRGVADLAARQGATPFMVLLSAFAGVLHEMSGQDDLAIGTPDSGRSRPQLDGVLGYLANTLVIRSRREASFADLLSEVRTSALDAYDHAGVPFEKLVEEVRPSRDLARSPLFQVLFILMPLAAPSLALPGVTAEPVDVAPDGAKFEMTLIVTPGGDSADWSLALEYNTDLFVAATADRALQRVLGLLTAAVSDPDVALADVALPADEQATLVRWGRDAAGELDLPAVHRQIEAQTARVPDRVAVSAGGRTLRYRDLDAQANRVARTLRELGCTDGDVVALATDLSPETFVGMLGVLKAGAAYVPIDPSYPVERTAHQLADSGASILLTTAAVAGALPPFAGTVVPIDLTGPGAGPVAVGERGPDDPAYVIYTSGSTGRPKGVVVRHGGLATLLAGMTEAHGLGEHDVFGAPTTPAFDLSVPDLYLPLVLGATVEVAPPSTVSDGPRLAEWLHTSGVTNLAATPTTWRLLLDAGWAPRGRFTAVCGGEMVPAELGHRLRDAGATVWHHYGPTEATVWATAHPVRPGDGPLPLGAPLPGVELRVMNPAGRRSPMGARGELWIGGTGVAAGYLGRPELTARQFVPDPEGGPGLLYRTGDVVRYRADGALDFVGRVDHQIKLRGFRIEPGEIESVLRERAEVRDAAVVVREDVPGEPRLVAYVEAASDLGVATVLEGLRARLPAHMVPSRVVVLPALPLTPNRKVDRAALPAPDALAGPDAGGPTSGAPRAGTEQELAALFAAALGGPGVGRDDDFFALGGHSLLAAKMHAEIRDRWPDVPPVRVVFEHPTVARLAAVLDGVGGVLDGAGRDPADDLDLAADIAPRPGPGRAWPPRQILLTGATGFLGSFLLSRLLAGPDTRVLCLVRGRDAGAARSRLLGGLDELGLLDEMDTSRVEVVPGDLAAPRLGLDAATFSSLADRVDLVVHSGAVVNYTQPYGHLRSANVDGTREVLRLAATGVPSAVHLVSSRAVFGRARPGARLMEDDRPASAPYDDNGYAQTKWVAERLAVIAGERGLPVTVHRPGRIAGDSGTGAWRSDDVACHLLRACAVVGMVPDTPMATDLVPVDRLADAIVGLVGQPESAGATFHFAAPHKTPIRLVAAALHEIGFPATLVPPAQWYDAVREHVRRDDDAGLALVVTEYGPLADGREWQESDFDCTNTESRLPGDLFPEVGVALLAHYVRAMVRTGLLPAPAGTEKEEQ